MVVITKKKIIYCLGIISLFLIAYLITGLSVKSSNKDITNTIETVALPVNNKVIVLDARTWKTR